MKKRGICIMGWLLAVCLAGCTAPASAPVPSIPAPGEAAVTCRIADGAEDGSLLLAGQGEDTGLYRLSTADLPITLDGETADLVDGMLVTVYFSGEVLESYPASFHQPTRLEAVSEGADDRVGLALQALDDLWSEDTALNENIEELSVYIDETLIPNPAERAAAAWRFAELHQLPPPMTYSWEELCDEGYVNKEELSWEKGLLPGTQSRRGRGNGQDSPLQRAKMAGRPCGHHVRRLHRETEVGRRLEV